MSTLAEKVAEHLGVASPFWKLDGHYSTAVVEGTRILVTVELPTGTVEFVADVRQVVA